MSDGRQKMAGGQRTIAVVGASNDRSKFGNKAVRAFRDEGWKVFPVHPTLSEVEGIPAYPSIDLVPTDHLDRVTLYVPPSIGLRILEHIARKDVSESTLR